VSVVQSGLMMETKYKGFSSMQKVLQYLGNKIKQYSGSFEEFNELVIGGVSNIITVARCIEIFWSPKHKIRFIFEDLNGNNTTRTSKKITIQNEQVKLLGLSIQP